MAISSYYIDTTFVSTDRRASVVEALKARKAPHRRFGRVVERVHMRSIFTECGLLALVAVAASFIS
jgi:hypothetical protein